MIHSKSELQADGANRKRHADMVASRHFRAFIAVALLEYLDRQSRIAGVNAEPAAASAHRLQGAREFVDVLMNLSELPTARSKKDHDNLIPE